MEDFGFDISGILSEEEASKLFEETSAADEQPVVDEVDNESEPAEEKEEPSSEKVGEEEKEVVDDAIARKGDGSSPNVYSSIASALKNDGIFPDFDDKDLEAVKTPEDFANLFEQAITSRLDERQKRIDAALGNGVEPDVVKGYEQTISYLDSITEEALSAEDEAGENLRKSLIYNDLVNRGYSQDKAMKELEKSFKSGSDIDDAKDALEALSKFYKDNYDVIQQDAKRRVESAKAAQKKQEEDFRKLVLDDEIKLGDLSIDKRTRQKVYDAVSKPVYKDPDTGKLLTAVQKFQKDNPMEFLKQLGMWYVLTNGGKDITGFTKGQVRAEKNKSIRELERKLNSTALSRDGSLQFVSGGSVSDDVLLSDDWKVGWK